MVNKTKKQKDPAKKRTGINIKNRTKGKPVKTGKKRDSLIPLLVILIILLAATSFITFSDNSSFLSELFSKDSNVAPLIERPEIEHSEVTKPETAEENSYAVTNETEIISEPEMVPGDAISEEPQKEMKSRLFYVKVSDEGQISLKSVIRTVHYNSKPLTETLNSLIDGPQRSELNKGLLNLIPKKSILNSIKISQRTAYLDFNEDFTFNSLGIEGYKAQLMQIVYTATDFSTVDKVKILINGESVSYLGAEGIFIGEALDRESFNTF